MNKNVFPAVAFLLGIVVIIVAAVVGFSVLPRAVDSQIKEEVQLVKGTDAWDRFEENPVPVFIEFYIFSITNPDFLDKRELPVFREVGPYVYQQIRLKNDFEFFEDETFTYVQNITYFYREDMSTKDPPLRDPVLTIINAPFLIVSQAIYELAPEIANLLIETLFVEHGESLVRTNVSADDFIFGGMSLIPSYNLILGFLDEIPANFEGGRFGFYRGVNETSDGLYRVDNGVRNARNVGKVVTWNGDRYLDWWESPKWLESDKVEDMYCNYLNGSDGSTFPPFLKKEDVLRVFVSDICRSIFLLYDQEVKHRDIPGYRYVLPKAFFEDPEINRDNYCFCPTPPGGLNDSCEEGLNRMFPCQDGAPIVASAPHFLMAGGEVARNAAAMGMKPTTGQHQTFIDVEPRTGSTLSIHKRLQINMELQPLPGVSHFSNVTRFVTPMFWVDEYADIDEKNADDIKSSLLKPLKIINISRWTVLAIGIVIFLSSVVMFVRFRK